MESSTLGAATIALLAPGMGDRVVLAGVINAAFSVYPFMRADRISLEGIDEEQGESGRFLVASRQGVIVACAMIRPSLDVHSEPESLEIPGGGDIMYLGLVAVVPQLRKQGLGRRLVASAEVAARDLGFAGMALGTLREMGNVDYYEALGYSVNGEQVFEPGHWGIAVPHHYCLMGKPL